MNVETSTEQPCKDKVNSVLACFDKDNLTAVTKKVLGLLRYKNLYLTNELVQIFMYVPGIERVKNTLAKHIQPGGGKLYTRLLDYCCDVACNEMK